MDEYSFHYLKTSDPLSLMYIKYFCDIHSFVKDRHEPQNYLSLSFRSFVRVSLGVLWFMPFSRERFVYAEIFMWIVKMQLLGRRSVFRVWKN